MTVPAIFFLGIFGWFASGNEPSAESRASIVFSGNESFSDARLLRELRNYRVNVTGSISITDADDAAFFLEEFYLGRGFENASVTYEFFPASGSAELKVFEGEKWFLGRLEFPEGLAFDQERLSDVVVSSLRQSSGLLFSRLRYVEFDMQTAAGALATKFHRSGYRGASVDFVAVPEESTRLVDVEFLIEPGPLYVVRSFRVRGEGDFDPLPLLAGAKGAPYTPDEDLLLRALVLRDMRSRGFHDAELQITPEFDTATGDVVLNVDFRTGPRFYFGDIAVQGNGRTFGQAALARLGVKRGDVFNSEALDAGLRRLWFTGAFSDVSVDTSETQNQMLDVLLTVEEGKARQVRGTTGYREWEQFFATIQYSDRNFLGTLNRLSVEAHVSQKGYYGLLQVADPFVFNTETTARATAFYLQQTLPAYEATFVGGILGLERLFEEPNLTGYRFQYQWRSVFDLTVFGEEDRDFSDYEYNVASLAWGQTLDRRNSPLSPMQGFLLRYDLLLASEALGGDLNYFKPEAQATWYLPFRQITPERPFVPFFMINHRAGLIAPFAGTGDVPSPERFYLGGPDSIRSFQLDGMGPRDRDADPLGGEIYWLVNLELQVPVWNALYLVGFSDAGNLSPTISTYDWEETRIAIGAGMRFYTPIGALRVDYGYNLIRRDGDPIGAWQFGFGFNF